MQLRLTVDGGRTASGVDHPRPRRRPADLVGRARSPPPGCARRDPGWPGLGAAAPAPLAAGNRDDADRARPPRPSGPPPCAPSSTRPAGSSTAGYVQTSCDRGALAEHRRAAPCAARRRRRRATASPGGRAPTAWPGAASAPARRPRRRRARRPGRGQGAGRGGRRSTGRPGRLRGRAGAGRRSPTSLACLASGQFNGKAVVDGASRASRLGEQQFDPAVSLVDDAAGRARPRCRSTPRAPPPAGPSWCATGSAGGADHDRRVAAALGRRVDRARLGRTRRPGARWPATPRSRPGDGGTVGRTLVAGLERGLLVSDFWYTRVVDPKTLGAGPG